MIGREFFNYVIESEIKAGGMAVVYKARHKSLTNTYRAIKVLNPALAMDPIIRAKFKTEAETVMKLNHPNIVKVENYSEQGHELCLIMEYIEGHPLDYMLKEITGPIPESRLIRIFSSLLDGFSYAHTKEIIHRDIKPSNIMIAPGDVPVIIDFGIVKIMEDGGNPGNTKTGTRIGTPMFMSPEQIFVKPLDKRSDIYSLGVTLFYMLTGRAPYDAVTKSEFEILQMVVNDPLPKAALFYPAVSSHMQALVDKATQKKKENRFNDCKQFKESLLDNGFAGDNEPAIRSFTISSDVIKKGEKVTINWDVTRLDSAHITGLGKILKEKGSVDIAPKIPTTYTLKTGSEEKVVFVDVISNSNKYTWIWIVVVLLIVLGVWGAIELSKKETADSLYNQDSQAYKDSVAAANTIDSAPSTLNYNDVDSSLPIIDKEKKTRPVEIKTRWSSADKSIFLTTCTDAAVKGGMADGKAKDYCSCMLDKIEVLYPNSQDAGKMDNTEVTEMAKDCLGIK